MTNESIIRIGIYNTWFSSFVPINWSLYVIYIYTSLYIASKSGLWTIITYYINNTLNELLCCRCCRYWIIQLYGFNFCHFNSNINYYYYGLTFKMSNYKSVFLFTCMYDFSLSLCKWIRDTETRGSNFTYTEIHFDRIMLLINLNWAFTSLLSKSWKKKKMSSIEWTNWSIFIIVLIFSW